MKSENLMDAIGMMDDDFLDESLSWTPKSGKMLLYPRRFLRNLIAAVLAVALLGGIALANTVPEPEQPSWELYAQSEELLDILFGSRRVTPLEGQVMIRNVGMGKLEDGSARYEEVHIPILSGASREPVSEELAALVEPYLIPVGKSVVDPTGTITLEIMAYLYEPQSQCGIVYLRLTDPTGAFCGYAPHMSQVVQTPGEEVETQKGIEIYLQQFHRDWGKPWANSGLMHMRLMEDLSDETTWTYAAYFFCDNYDTVDFDIGFETAPGVDYRPYRIDIDLERTPTMKTLVLGNAGNKELITVSPVGMCIGEDTMPRSEAIHTVVLHFRDGSSYVVMDDEITRSALQKGETCTYGYASRANGHFAFANIIDVGEIYYVEVNGRHYFNIDW